MSTERCDNCLNSTEVHNGKAAEVFLMAVVNVPGRTPVIVSTPKFCKDMPTAPTPCDICTLVGELADESVIKGAVDVAAEIRNRFKPQDMMNAAEFMARCVLACPPAVAAQELANVKAANPALHALVVAAVARTKAGPDAGPRKV